MTNEQKDMIATYITTFKNLLARHLQPDVAIRTSVFPTPDEVLLIMTLNRDNQGGVEFRSECPTTTIAFQRSGIDPNLLPESELSHKVGVCASSIVSLKSYDAKNWTTSRPFPTRKRRSVFSALSELQKEMYLRYLLRKPLLSDFARVRSA